MAKVIAVIHHRDDATSLRNAAIASSSGCVGIALIQMDGLDDLVDVPAMTIKAAHPGLTVIANRLSSPAPVAIRRDAELGLDGSWSDDLIATSDGALPLAAEVRDALAEVRARNPCFAFFGSVAFKGQRPERDPAGAARIAAREPWIVTTSGPGTGHAPDRGKLLAMNAAVGRDVLAVASGITPANAPDLAPLVGWVLVATGVSSNFHDLDAALLTSVVSGCGDAA